MKRSGARILLSALLAAALCGCASTPAYQKEECPLYTELGAVRANPAGAPGRHLQVEAAFRVCPPVEGLAEIKRKRIELKHHLLNLLSAKTELELEDPLRVEKLQKEVLRMVNQEIMRKGQVVQVLITGFEVQ